MRVTHPRFNTEARTIYVIGVRPSPRPLTSARGDTATGSPAAGPSGGTSPTKEVGKAVEEGVNAVKKIFR